MSLGRRWVVYGLFAFVLGGNLVSFIINRQIWPYSPYPMFANARDLTFETLVLVGEPVDGGEFWFESQGYLSAAISPMVINNGFDAVRARPGISGLDERLRDTYEFYERRRQQGLSSGPPLRRLHLYRFSWAMRPDLANLHTPRRALIGSYPSDNRSAQ